MAAATDRKIMQIMILDQGIIQFNAKPRDGIAFLIKNKVISDDTLEIAKFLATTDKLDKHVLGNFLGKDNDFSVAVLNIFASLFHYEGVSFDIALRSFTSRFAMPGESQMIYRILERFAVYYSQSNPNLDKDKALILSYALIMLNVDLHSSRVKDKMTKEEFVRNTELALGSAISREELEKMYLRLLEKELKPELSAEEVVYSKLAVNPKYSARGALQSGEATAQVIEQLKSGAILLKYGREGTPHPRKVFLSSDGKRLCWIDPKKLEKLEKKQIKKVLAEKQQQMLKTQSPTQAAVAGVPEKKNRVHMGSTQSAEEHDFPIHNEQSRVVAPVLSGHSKPPPSVPEVPTIAEDSRVEVPLSDEPSGQPSGAVVPVSGEPLAVGVPTIAEESMSDGRLSDDSRIPNEKQNQSQCLQLADSVGVHDVQTNNEALVVPSVETNIQSVLVQDVEAEYQSVLVPGVETKIESAPVHDTKECLRSPSPAQRITEMIGNCFPSRVQSGINMEAIPTPKAGELVKGGGNDLDFLRTVFIKIRSSGVVSEESFKREVPLEDITGLVVGTGGTRNLRRHFQSIEVDDVETEQRCFSIITDYRTLDLQAPPGVDIQPWLHFFHSVLSEREKRLRALADKNKDIWSFTQKERASLVRWQEIVPQWSDHWLCGARPSAGGGYRASQHPKEELLHHKMFFVNPSGFVLDRGQRLETAVSPQIVALWLEGIPSSVRPRVWPIAAGNNLRLDDAFFSKLIESLNDEEDDSSRSGLNVSMVVENQMDQSVSQSVTESVFYGITANPHTPSKIASSSLPVGTTMVSNAEVIATTGPISFEKELERELKSSSMRKFANRALTWIDARGSREQQAFFKSSNELNEFMKKRRRGAGWSSAAGGKRSGMASPLADENVLSSSDAEEAKSEDSWDSRMSPMNSGWENVYAATKLLVSAFLTQRKDIKYVRGMAVLASMVIFNVGIHDLSRTFSVFSNLLHQHYFFDFFTLRWRDMRMRFDLYGKLLRERMPYLDDHFNAIQITSDLYFNQWLLTGFTRVLPFRTACRVWDGFLLLGESYFFTAALALLNYYEHSLMTSGFSGCLEILLGHADEVLFNDKKFFECVHQQSVSNERFAAWISAQRLAEEKTGLYDLLLLM